MTSAARPQIDPAARALDACPCHGCGRLVTGGEGDTKVCVVHDKESLVLCAPCFWRDERREAWLEWRVDFSRASRDPWALAFERAVEVG